MSGTERPLILALTGDYFFVPRIEDAVRSLGFQFEVIESPRLFGDEGPPMIRKVPLTEPLEGPDAAFMRGIVDRRPALLLVDVSSEDIPWERWVHTLKTSAATRRIPIIAFGPHVDEVALKSAEDVGADLVVTRGRLQASLPELIKQNASVVDREALGAACEGALSELGAEGLALLNSGEYFEAHEVLEHAWMEASELEGFLYRALLQVSVAYLQVERDNYAGAVKMMLRVRQWLEPLPRHCRGVDVEKLKGNVAEFAEALNDVGEQGLSELDPSLLRPVPLLDHAE